MNRQARFEGSGDWVSYGAVTFAEAAQLHARIDCTQRQSMCIELRDEGSDITRTLTVDRVISYRVRGLRGGQS